MAKKQKKKRNKKYRQKYTTGGRLDMRNGGRVGYQTGGESIRTPLQQKRKKIEGQYKGVHEFKPNYRGPCFTKNFDGEHPEIIQSNMQELKEKFEKQLSKYV